MRDWAAEAGAETMALLGFVAELLLLATTMPMTAANNTRTTGKKLFFLAFGGGGKGAARTLGGLPFGGMVSEYEIPLPGMEAVTRFRPVELIV